MDSAQKCPFGHGTTDNTQPQGGRPSVTVKTPGPVGVISDQGGNALTFLAALNRQYGDTVRFQTPYGPCFLISKPEDIQAIQHSENFRRPSLLKFMLGNGVLSSDGSRWRWQRRQMQRDFLPAAIAPFEKVIAQETDITAHAWRSSAGQPVDVSAAMTDLTLRIILRALFSESLDPQISASFSAAVTQTIEDLATISHTVFGTPMNFTPAIMQRFNKAKATVDGVCYEIIARRRAMAPEARPDDLLTLLLEAETEEGPVTDTDLRDQIVTMIIAGHETTAVAISWTFKALGDNPEAKKKLYDELDGTTGHVPKPADLTHLPWTTAALKESMRLYPPVWYQGRVSIREDVIGGHVIPRNACVIMSAWITHRDPKLWSEPDRFDPARFLDPAPPLAHRYAYFPFGGGRHQCLGMHLAMMEATMVISRLAQEFELELTNSEQVRPDPVLTLRQTPSMMALVHIRSRTHTTTRSSGRAA